MSPVRSSLALASLALAACNLFVTAVVELRIPQAGGFAHFAYLLSIMAAFGAALSAFRQAGRLRPTGMPRFKVDLGALGILFLSIAFILVRLHYRAEIDSDDVEQFNLAMGGARSTLDAGGYQNMPPLDCYFTAFAGLVFGRRPLAYISHPAFFSILSLPLFWLLARSLFRSQGSRWLAFCLFGFSPFLILYSTVARP